MSSTRRFPSFAADTRHSTTIQWLEQVSQLAGSLHRSLTQQHGTRPRRHLPDSCLTPRPRKDSPGNLFTLRSKKSPSTKYDSSAISSPFGKAERSRSLMQALDEKNRELERMRAECARHTEDSQMRFGALRQIFTRMRGEAQGFCRLLAHADAIVGRGLSVAVSSHKETMGEKVKRKEGRVKMMRDVVVQAGKRNEEEKEGAIEKLNRLRGRLRRVLTNSSTRIGRLNAHIEVMLRTKKRNIQ